LGVTTIGRLKARKCTIHKVIKFQVLVVTAILVLLKICLEWKMFIEDRFQPLHKKPLFSWEKW